MLVSHRRHTFGDAGLELHRVIGPSWVMRSARLRGPLAQDSRTPLAAIGAGTQGRMRIVVVLSGRVSLFVGSRVVHLRAGDAAVQPRDAHVASRAESSGPSGSVACVEFDLDDDACIARSQPRALETGPIGASALLALEELAHAIESASSDALPCVAPAATEALDALASRGFPLLAEGVPEAWRDPVRLDEQRLYSELDSALSDLSSGANVDALAERIGVNRRTLARRAAQTGARHRLGALGRTDLRSARDSYRLLVGTILLSHPRMTTGALAKLLGYASPQALCHAFAHAGLPSPLSLAQTVRA